MRKAEPFVVACIPAFNEESSIGAVVVRTRGYVDGVLVCDDGSRDLTGDIAVGGWGRWWCGMSGTSVCLLISKRFILSLCALGV